jgi:hypothetical protein
MATKKTLGVVCVNCSKPGFYLYKVNNSVQYWYCRQCLPTFLHAQRDAGNLVTSDALDVAQQEAIDILKTDIPQYKAEEAPVTETPSATKKKIAVEPDEE